MGNVADKVANKVADPKKNPLGHNLASGFVSFGIYAGISFLTNKFFGGDADDDSANFRRSIIINTDIPIGNRKIIYGTRQVGGQIVYREANDIGFNASRRPHGSLDATRTYDDPFVGDNDFLDYIIAVAGHECNAITGFYVNDTLIELDRDGYGTNGYEGIHFEVRLGADDDEPLTDAQYLRGNPSGFNWTEDHQLKGICYVHVRMFKYRLENVPQFSFRVEGKKLYDPRTNTTIFSNNPALIMNDYLRGDYGANLDEDQIDEETLIASANTCEEQVELSDGTFQGRYTCDLVIDRGVTIRTAINEIETTLGAPKTESQGKIFINAGDYHTPAVTIDDSWFISRIEMVTRVTRRDLVNTVRGTYIDEERDWQPNDFPEVTNELYVEQDGGKKLYLDIELPATLHAEQAQRMARIILEKVRQGITFQARLDLRALQLKVWDIVAVTFEPFGWEEKPFRIMEWELLEDVTGIRCSFQEEAEESYDWNTGDATLIDPAPDTNLDSPLFVEQVFIRTITEELYETTGGFASQAIVEWEALDNIYLLGYRLSYRHEDEEEFTQRPIVTETRDTIRGLRIGQYTFQLIAINSYQIESDPTETTFEVRGVVAPPRQVRLFEYDIVSGNIHLRWELATRTDLDVLIGGAVIVKHSSSTSGTWTNSSVVGRIAGNSTELTLPYRDGTYLIKFEDQGGRQSLNASSVLAIGENIVARNQIIDLMESPEFRGTTANMSKTSHGLELARTSVFDDQVGDFDDQEGNFDDGGGTEFQTSGIYLFEDYADAGRVVDMHITSEVEFTASYLNDRFDNRDGNFDDQEGTFDGADLNLATVVLDIATTDVDPRTAHSLEFTDRGILTAGDFRARGADFELSVQTVASNVRLIITHLRVIVDLPDIIQRGSLEQESNVPVQITFDREFYSIPTVTAVNLDGNINHVAMITSVTREGFTVSVHNTNNNNLVPINIAWLAGGF